jgi:hypothetical protein
MLEHASRTAGHRDIAASLMTIQEYWQMRLLLLSAGCLLGAAGCEEIAKAKECSKAQK